MSRSRHLPCTQSFPSHGYSSEAFSSFIPEELSVTFNVCACQCVFVPIRGCAANLLSLSLFLSTPRGRTPMQW